MADQAGRPTEPRAGLDVDYVRERVRQSLDDLTHRRWRNLGIALLVAVIVGGFAIHQLTSRPQSVAPEDVLPRATPTSVAAALPTAGTSGQGDVVVHVAGAVAHPGVYVARANDRVNDVIRESGGLTTDADSDRINLAAKLTDGQRVYVPKKGEAAPPADTTSATGAAGADENATVDLNTATVADLDKLPGVGPATAQAIVQYRTTNGPFRSVADLAKVKGIGPSKLNDLRPRVRV